MIFYEYVYDTATLARAKDLRNVMVTAGYINEAPWRKLCRYVDAANIDLKGFTDKFYRSLCGAELPKILETLEYVTIFIFQSS